jgi:hypothetical protein
MPLKNTLLVQSEIIQHIIIEFYTLSAAYVQHNLQSCVTTRNLHVLVESTVYTLKVETMASRKIS